MKCKKCGAILHPEQKICMDCGTETHLWPGGVKKAEEPVREIPWKAISIIGGAILLVAVIIIIVLHLRVIPPDQVARNWLDAVINRSTTRAKEFTTDKFESNSAGSTRSTDMSDQYVMLFGNEGGDYTVSQPQYDSPNNPTAATVVITLRSKNGQTLTQQIILLKEDSKWKVDAVVS